MSQAIMIRPAEPRMRGSDPKSAVYFANLNKLRSIDDDLAEADAARAYLAQVSAPLVAAGVIVETITPWGDPASEILDVAETQHVEQVVMATHGRSGPGRWLYGSVADAVLRQSQVPIVLVPPDAKLAWPTHRPLRILVPLDGSETGEAVLGPVQNLAYRFEAEVVLLQVVVWPPVVYGDATELIAYNPDDELSAAGSYLADVARRLTIANIRCQTAEVTREIGFDSSGTGAPGVAPG